VTLCSVANVICCSAIVIKVIVNSKSQTDCSIIHFHIDMHGV